MKNYFFKICIISALIISTIITVAWFGKNKPKAFVSSKPLTREEFVPEDMFKVNQTINFMLIKPKGFKSDKIRMQLIKKSKLSAMWGETLVLGKDYNVEEGYFLTGSFTTYSGGRYVLVFYDFVLQQEKQRKGTIWQHKIYGPPEPDARIEFGVLDN